ncbi:LysR family transcriptional regulator [Paenibacillus sp. TRM 82003]|uniref:LysR family transcriptional regulator n=1 Tax=Kineococcus sp. TRM81007 TaxID=2925831 RepID=UPI001F5A0A83|nr:LysR family transcriptional regulator [Kineococcus sp. TRM81007]MCI2240420.1 LysR family transcriptional regulator [Kineococcus sp. TRM81007]MCI3927404.1 LysR family transcriptional regulator [Paenibacillus sp. TRM 82003]
MNLRNLDLNLLVALDALLQQRSVTRAAAQVGLSQPALSASLARLRRHFDDPLLTRVGNEHQLTPLAVRLREQARVALAGVERVFSAEPDFDPSSSEREVHVVSSDYAEAVLSGPLTALLAAEAPGVRLRFSANTPSVVENAERTLVDADLLLLPHGFLTDTPHADLHRDRWVCVVAEDNPDVGAELHVEQLRSMPWVVTYHGPRASTPAALQMRMLGVEPHVQVVTEHFLTVPALVAGSGRIALLQERLARRLLPGSGVRALVPPLEIGPLVEAMWWHPVYTADPEHTWVRDVVRRAASSLPPVPA